MPAIKAAAAQRFRILSRCRQRRSEARLVAHTPVAVAARRAHCVAGSSGVAELPVPLDDIRAGSAIAAESAVAGARAARSITDTVQRALQVAAAAGQRPGLRRTSSGGARPERPGLRRAGTIGLPQAGGPAEGAQLMLT